MSTFESDVKNTLREIDKFRTRECLDPRLVGLLAENKLSGEEKRKAEGHLQNCLYCLKQLNDMKELLYYCAHPAKISPEMNRRLRALYRTAEKKSDKESAAKSLFQRLKALAAFPARQWKYSAVGLAAACVAMLVCFFVLQHAAPFGMAPYVDANSFVKVRAFNDDGAVVNEAQGVVVNSRGLVASELSQLVGASAVQITSRDGRTYRTTKVWRDEDKNLAVLEIDNKSLPSIPMADLREISIGQGVFLVADGAVRKRDFKESFISDFKQAPGRRKGGPIRYIQLATLTTSASRGAIVDGQGKLVGLLIAQEKRISLAAPIGDAERLARESRAVPLSELKGVKFSTEALNFYLKGILARDEQRWEEAMGLLKKAVELNPNLEGAHLELAYAYYKKRLYGLEAQEYEDVLKINPENTDALFGLASNLETRGEYGEAIKTYEKVLAIDREDADTYYQLGLAYLAQGNKGRAMWAYARLKALDQGYAEMLRRLSK